MEAGVRGTLGEGHLEIDAVGYKMLIHAGINHPERHRFQSGGNRNGRAIRSQALDVFNGAVGHIPPGGFVIASKVSRWLVLNLSAHRLGSIRDCHIQIRIGLGVIGAVDPHPVHPVSVIPGGFRLIFALLLILHLDILVGNHQPGGRQLVLTLGVISQGEGGGKLLLQKALVSGIIRNPFQDLSIEHDDIRLELIGKGCVVVNTQFFDFRQLLYRFHCHDLLGLIIPFIQAVAVGSLQLLHQISGSGVLRRQQIGHTRAVFVGGDDTAHLLALNIARLKLVHGELGALQPRSVFVSLFNEDAAAVGLIGQHAAVHVPGGFRPVGNRRIVLVSGNHRLIPGIVQGVAVGGLSFPDIIGSGI